ncbi:MAG: NAD(P)-dependent alcohol dehydrogenase [Saprospiraceae bacterium]|nr:NAD(P)-dependent alcohol dehydrogenase [Saprospiraceae bacterium]
MKGVITTAYGSPEVFKYEEVSKPTPKPNEILVKIHASSITTADTMMRTGKPYIGRLMLGFTKPKNPIWGTGFAGIVEETGAEVTQFKPGDKVFGESLDSFGTYAEYVTIAEDDVVRHLPASLSFEEAACLGDGGVTSYNFLKNVCNVSAGDKVLINGASGALGTAAIQIAKYLGAEVTAVCSVRNVQLVKELGADHVIDYTIEDFTDRTNAYDFIYDTIGRSSFSDCRDTLTKNGVYASPVIGWPILRDMMLTAFGKGKKAKFSATGALPKKEIKQMVSELITMVEASQFKGVIDRTYPLKKVTEAHYYISQGHKIGNVVLTPAY